MHAPSEGHGAGEQSCSWLMRSIFSRIVFKVLFPPFSVCELQDKQVLLQPNREGFDYSRQLW